MTESIETSACAPARVLGIEPCQVPPLTIPP